MDLNKEIEEIKKRNKRVELDKAWETSWTRKICICIITYIVVVAYSYMVRNYDNIFLSSLVPVIGFTLSTLSLKYVRKIWEKKYDRWMQIKYLLDLKNELSNNEKKNNVHSYKKKMEIKRDEKIKPYIKRYKAFLW